MNISVEAIKGQDAILAPIKDIYTRAFPVDEQRPWDDIVRKVECGHDMFTLHAIMLDGKPAGMISTWDFPDAIYIEHFAIDPSMRQNGLGSKTLTQLLEKATVPVVLEVELPEEGEMAKRRIGFYKRHGFKEYPEFHYIQPPYSPDLSSLEMMIMASAEIDPGHIRDLLYGFVYGAK